MLTKHGSNGRAQRVTGPYIDLSEHRNVRMTKVAELDHCEEYCCSALRRPRNVLGTTGGNVWTDRCARRIAPSPQRLQTVAPAPLCRLLGAAEGAHGVHACGCGLHAVPGLGKRKLVLRAHDQLRLLTTLERSNCLALSQA